MDSVGSVFLKFGHDTAVKEARFFLHFNKWLVG
jgi:hypothetical protein